MYAKYMDWFSRIFNVSGALDHLAHTLFTDGMHYDHVGKTGGQEVYILTGKV